jgi:hypothetical protein
MVVKRNAAEMFIEAAEASTSPQSPSNPVSRRDFKSIRVPFNEREYQVLERLAVKTGRSKLNVIRWALAQLAEQEEVEKEESSSAGR